MRIAVTGTHGSGKTTLIGDFLDTHRHYEHAQEPYWELAQQGMPFADGPTTDDLAEQLDQSARMILATVPEPNIIFDRCPLDFIAYLEIVNERDDIEWTPTGKQLTKIEAALASLDVIVFLPLSVPDEIDASIEFPKLRRKVDERLKLIVREDVLGLLAGGPRVVEINGSRSARLAELLKAVSAG